MTSAAGNCCFLFGHSGTEAHHQQTSVGPDGTTSLLVYKFKLPIESFSPIMSVQLKCLTSNVHIIKIY